MVLVGLGQGVPSLEEVPERELGIHGDMELRSWRRAGIEGKRGLSVRVLQERPELWALEAGPVDAVRSRTKPEK